MRSLRQILANNTPTTKPELWTNLPAVLRRRVGAWLSERLDDGWSTRPFITTVGDNGLLLEVVPGDAIGRPIVYFGMYEYAVTQLLRAYLKRDDTFIDVGANLGYYSVVAADLVGSRGRVLAFEPSIAMRARLKRNVTLNQLQQVEIRAEALGDKRETVRLVTPTVKANDGLAYVTREGHDGVEVPCIRLDEVAFGSKPPALVKVDVEGGEPQVFAGASGLLETNDAPSILFESFEPTRDASVLRRFGYKIFQPRLERGIVTLSDDLQAPRYRRWEAPNYFAVKNRRGLDFVEARLSRA